MIRYLLFTLSTLLCWNALCARTWTDAQGRTFDGEYISADVDEVRVRRGVDGMVFRLPIAQLSQQDQDFVYEKLGLHWLKIDSMKGKGAFRGVIDAYWVAHEDRITITVRTWSVRFPGGQHSDETLVAVYFAFAAYRYGHWTTVEESERVKLDLRNHTGELLMLKDLNFTLDLNDPQRKGYALDELCLVANYIGDDNGQEFFNSDYADTYAFSGKPRK
ncbi:hypothetical protein [Cerasicoccus frondis]|uniref:hypothetical protein n=1 Tax=Cerasicoccus frondis TaxID=490090 RepID=UPI0028524ADC|nr:hypothetical protein [Cerasicoccus frondis]